MLTPARSRDAAAAKLAGTGPTPRPVGSIADGLAHPLGFVRHLGFARSDLGATGIAVLARSPQCQSTRDCDCALREPASVSYGATCASSRLLDLRIRSPRAS